MNTTTSPRPSLPLRGREGEANEQLALIDGESDEAMMLPRDEAVKRYTARTAEKLEIRRDCILALIGCGLPVDFIAEKAHCSSRIVKLLGAKYATAVAQNTRKMCDVLGALAMKAAFHLDGKLADARPGELGVIMGISLQRKQEMELGLTPLDDGEKAIELEQESPALASARKFLEERNLKVAAT